jgi:hypothetical protein
MRRHSEAPESYCVIKELRHPPIVVWGRWRVHWAAAKNRRGENGGDLPIVTTETNFYASPQAKTNPPRSGWNKRAD